MQQKECKTDYAKLLVVAMFVGFAMAVLLAPSMWLVRNEFEQQKIAHAKEIDGLLREIAHLEDKLIICEGER